MGPRRLLTTVVALGGGAFLLGAGLLRLETHLTGVAGQFRAERCEVSGSRHGDDGWLCSGSFEADNHAFRIDRVEVDTTFDKQPAEPVATFVDGPTSTTAVEKDNGVWLLPGGPGLVCLLAGAWNIRSAVKRPREALVAAPA